MKDAIHLLGVRGSVPVCGSAFARYGGQTTCIFLRLDGQAIVLDAGSGLLDLDSCLKPDEDRCSLLLTHPHVDHLLGLPLCPALLRSGFHMELYAVARAGLSPQGQVRALMSPPLWPVGPEALPGQLHFHMLPETLHIGHVLIQRMEGVHPGGVSLLRLTANGRSVVLATDCTFTPELLPQLTDFAMDCDVLLCDGQYTDEEWLRRSTFGHNTARAAAELGLACRAGKTMIIHHDPAHTDAMLDDMAAELKRDYPNCSFARVGEEIDL